MLAFFTNDWVPFVCSTDISIDISATKIAVRTLGDGHWKKYTYQDCTFTITLSGLLKFDDDESFTGWNVLDNLIGFSQVLCRISFDDENGDVKTMQGTVMVENGTISYSPGALVKNDFNLQGSGSLAIFDGLIPCPSTISSITVDGQEAADGTVSITYTYTGDPYQVKYRIDNTGDYVYALVGAALMIPGLFVGKHSTEIIPICSNGYEGTGFTQSFAVTQALVCNSAITGMVIHTSDSTRYSNLSSGVTVVQDATSDYILPVMSGSASTYLYGIDLDPSSPYSSMNAGQPLAINNLGVGIHNIGLIPSCTFDGGKQVQGSGMAFSFTRTSQASQSQISYDYEGRTSSSFSIYVNGVQVVAQAANAVSDNFVVPVGASVRVALSCTQSVVQFEGPLEITDVTTSEILYSQTGFSPFSLMYTFVANGDSYNITASITPS